MLFGYARVSTTEQKEDRQLLEIRKRGVPSENIFVDKKSGKDFERPAYLKMYRKLRSDDVLIIKSIDRLGRNYNQILEEWEKITKKKGADIIVIDMPLLDTTRGKDLLGTLISDIVLQLLSFVAENERANIRQRQKEGIKIAMDNGVRFGRPPLEIPPNYAENYENWRTKKITADEGAQNCNIPLWAFYRLGKRIEEENPEDIKI